MKMNQMEEIYKNMKNNSIGNDKKCSYKKVTKKAKLKRTIASILTILIISTFSGCYLKSSKDRNLSSETQQTEITNLFSSDFDVNELIAFEETRAIELLKDNGFSDFDIIGFKREYNYTVDEFKEISGLDNTYLYGLYAVTTNNTFDKILKSLDYENLDDFLTQNNYVNNKNQPSVKVWNYRRLGEMRQIMENEKMEIKTR